jgi:hypothetical protein
MLVIEAGIPINIVNAGEQLFFGHFMRSEIYMTLVSAIFLSVAYRAPVLLIVRISVYLNLRRAKRLVLSRPGVADSYRTLSGGKYKRHSYAHVQNIN